MKITVESVQEILIKDLKPLDMFVSFPMDFSFNPHPHVYQLAEDGEYYLVQDRMREVNPMNYFCLPDASNWSVLRIVTAHIDTEG